MYKLGQISQYTNQPDSVTKIENGLSIPFDPDNTDYQQYLKWVAEGNEPLPAEEPATPAPSAAADEGVA